MVRGEEQQFEVAVDRLLEHTRNIKISLLYFVQRIETDPDKLNWPQVLDSFSTICGQMNTLLRFAREHKSLVENRVVLPLLISPDRDEDLVKMTEGRVQICDHEFVPNYLRTRPETDIEEQEKALQIKTSTISPDMAVRQVNAMNKMIDNVANTVKASILTRPEQDSTARQAKTTYNISDTNEIILAINTGQGLRNPHAGMHAVSRQEALMAQRVREQTLQQQLANAKQNVKAPELKTNIKAGP